ncbi:MAG: aminotransferase class I/II-fold pyridoxal phosphate-dependent enzyme [Armatimonadetes bacterium]|nr:aminotransferase class I/II-fold pyridoxal phosphate-dependent enzyme [Armatimonadota bacterium]
MVDETCYHGGAFWERLDPRFHSPNRFGDIINADVLDAWFPPSPRVADALADIAQWSMQTSPPTYSEGLIAEIASHYAVPEDQLLVGAGSSSLWFLFASRTLRPSSHVLLIEPSYGEYAHACEQVVGCRVTRLTLLPDDGFRLDLEQWTARLADGAFDLAVLVNPNNPTGQPVDRDDLLAALRAVPRRTLVLIDEAYMEFWNPGESLLSVADLPPNVSVVCSFSKRFALSGLRAAMLRTNPHLRSDLSRWTPPWAVSLPAQAATCAAFRDLAYYHDRYQETHRLRGELASGLAGLGLEVHDSCANWLNLRVPRAEAFRAASLREGLFVRNLGKSAPSLGDEWVRVAVKDASTNQRMVDAIGSIVACRT